MLQDSYVFSFYHSAMPRDPPFENYISCICVSKSPPVEATNNPPSVSSIHEILPPEESDMLLHSRSQNRSSSTPSMAKLQFKLARIVSRHDDLKASFHQLKSQIKIGLLEAEDVFTSLAVPLTKLVGLKTAEMDEEGRSSTIFMNCLPAQVYSRNETSSETSVRSPPTTEREYEENKFEEDYVTRATMAGKELIQKQRLQLTQLMDLLKQIEGNVNSSHNTISQAIDDHKTSVYKYFQKAITYISAIHHSNQDNGAFLITLKLLKATYDHVRAVLGSVEGGVDDMMHELAEQMCTPMVEYVKNIKAEMTRGTCPRLLTMLEEMGGAVRNGRLELEQAKKKVRIAEGRKHEALSRLKESEEKVKKMKENLGFYLEAKSGSTERFAKHKFIGLQEDQTKEDKLLWELLKKKKKHQPPDSPFGPEGLLPVGINNKHLRSRRGRPSITCRRPMTQSYLKELSPQTPCMDSWLPLGSSPSATTQQVLSRKRITP